MEEILQSIKRIIAEEGDAPAPAANTGDVLELTEMLADDGSVVKPAAVDAGVTQAVAAMTIDEIMASNDGKIADHMIPAPEAVVEAPQPVEPAPIAMPAPAVVDEAPLVSEATLASAAAAMQRLREIPSETLQHVPHQSMGFRSGTTVEDLVLESLKPMLREWLEDNLTEIVEHLVEREVRKLTAR